LLWCNKVPKGKRNKPAKINGIQHHEVVSTAVPHTYYRSLSEWTTNQFNECPLPLDFPPILCHTMIMTNKQPNSDMLDDILADQFCSDTDTDTDDFDMLHDFDVDAILNFVDKYDVNSWLLLWG